MEAKDFSALRISLASPEQVRSWSYGEVTKPETINYRRLRPEMDGLFCERIFGPTRDWQCYCGKYKNIRYRGIICDKCGVEVTRSAVRRERMGHIELAAPVAHVWYTRRVPSYLGLLLDVSRRNLDRVLYFAQYVVTQVDEDARSRAVSRIRKELALKEQELAGGIEERMNEQRGDHDQRAEEFDSKVKAIRDHFDGELARLSDEVMSEAQSAQLRVESLLGQTAPAAINLESIEAVVVDQGETIANDHISRIQAVVNDYLSGLQSEIEDLTRQEIAKVSGEMDSANMDLASSMNEQLAELEDRLETVREAAENQIIELKKLQSLQFLAEKPDMDKSKYEFFLSEGRYRELKSRFGNVFQAGMGAEAFYDILSDLNLEKMNEELWREVRTTRSKQRRKKATKRLRVVESLQNSRATVTDTDETNQENEPNGNRPEWMILTALPVIPPDLRPMVQLDGGRFATSDLNDLYRRVINRNNRLKHLLDLGAPDVIVRNEKRMLQEAVDSLIDNSQRGKALSRRGRRELKSLSDMLKGKKGRFRRNLLGKRVDYSGRSVIVIGPKLKLHQCGLPKTMALELYRPFVISRLVNYNYASNVKGAKRIIERERPEVWEILEEVIKERPVLLNRAPTLHRLGIQAFEPLLVEGKAIQIHPLVCSAFNADFDGDQMAVHIPLSDQAVKEARDLMLSVRNLLKPSDGMPIVGPSKDMVLGNYYLTMDPTVEIMALKTRADEFRSEQALYAGDRKVGIAFRSNGYYYAQFRKVTNSQLFLDKTAPDDNGRPRVVETAVDRTVQALLAGEVDCMLANAYEMRKYLRAKGLEDRLEITNLHERRAVVDMDEVEYLYRIGLVGLHTPILLGNVYDQNDHSPKTEPEICTVGRAIFNRILPDEMRFVQETLGKKGLQKLVDRCYRVIGAERTTAVVDSIKNYGFHYATISGTTIAVNDLTVPDERAEIMRQADGVVSRAERDFRRGLMTEEERYQITVDEWNRAKEYLQERIQDTLDPYGPIAIMAVSGSTKGGFGPITQLAGMRGLMADPYGRIIDLPIRSHFREGLNVLEYFLSTHGARKGLTDTALRTADAGYLTRRLVDVAQDMIVNRWDCHTERGLIIKRSDDIAGQTIEERIVGRCAADDVHHSEKHEIPDGWAVHVSDGQDIGEGETIASHREEHEIPDGWAVHVSDGQDIGEGETIASRREEHRSEAAGMVRVKGNAISIFSCSDEFGYEIPDGWELQVKDGQGIEEGAVIASYGVRTLLNDLDKIRSSREFEQSQKRFDELARKVSSSVISDVDEIKNAPDGETAKQHADGISKTISDTKEIVDSYIRERRGLEEVIVQLQDHLAVAEESRQKLKVLNLSEALDGLEKATNEYTNAWKEIRDVIKDISDKDFDEAYKVIRNFHGRLEVAGKSVQRVFEQLKAIKESAVIAGHSEELASLRAGTVHIEGNVVYIRDEHEYKIPDGWELQVTDGQDIGEGAVIASYGVRTLLNDLDEIRSSPEFEQSQKRIDKLAGKVKLGAMITAREIRDGQLSADKRRYAAKIISEAKEVVDSYIRERKGLEEVIVRLQDHPAVAEESRKELKALPEALVGLEDKTNEYTNAWKEMQDVISEYQDSGAKDISDMSSDERITKAFKLISNFYGPFDGDIKTIKGADTVLQKAMDTIKGAVIANSEELASLRAGTVYIEGNVVYICDEHEYEMPAEWEIHVADGEVIKEGAVIASRIQERKSSLSGTVRIEDIKKGGTVIAVAGRPFRSSLAGTVYIEDSAVYVRTLIVGRNELIDEDIAEAIQNSSLEEVEVRSPLTCDLINGVCALCYGRDLGSGEMVNIGSAVGIIAAQSIGEPGTQLTLRTFHTGGTVRSGGDITSGLPRVEELFEARQKPKGESVMTDIGGILRLTEREDSVRIATVIDSEVFSETHEIPADWDIHATDGKDIKEGAVIASHDAEDLRSSMAGTVHIEDNIVYIRSERREEQEYEIPANARLRKAIVDGMEVKPGDQLTEGSKNPHHILRVLGPDATQFYLLGEIQEVYRSQGVNIADKHFETVIRKMMCKVQITSSGDSDLLPGELIDELKLKQINDDLTAENKEPSSGAPVLLGITKAALSTESYLSAASFQHTIKVLAGAAIEGKVDPLHGLKENVIIGKLIPAGTGFHAYQDGEDDAPPVTLEAEGTLDLDDFGDPDDFENMLNEL